MTTNTKVMKREKRAKQKLVRFAVFLPVVGITALVFCTAVTLAAPPQSAATGSEERRGAKDGYWKLSGRKLTRGLQNVGTGWLEVPAGVHSAGEKHGVGAAATIGLLDGLGRAISRTAIGVFEVVTFPFGVPQNFEPLIDPKIGRKDTATP